MNVLSVDWDYFTPIDLMHELDWGHSETFSPVIQEFLWISRGANFIMHSQSLPTTSGEEIGFWDKFTFTRDTRVFIADSHMHMVADDIRQSFVTHITNYDAHHDGGFSKNSLTNVLRGDVDCANWLAWYALVGATCEVVYPTWRERDSFGNPQIDDISITYDRKEFESYDIVFVCKSPSWTPPWLDGAFDSFIDSLHERLPRTVFTYLEEVKTRNWDESVVRDHIQQLERFRVDSNG